MDKDDALKLALGALEAETDPNWECNSYHPKIWEAITAIKQALAAQPAAVQEPVALGQEREAFEAWHDSFFVNKGHAAHHRFHDRDGYCIDDIQNQWKGWKERAKRTTPPAATQPAVPLTKDEALKLALEALEGIHPGNMTPMAEEYWNKAITFCKQALAAQPAPVPLTDEQIDVKFEAFASKFDHESNEWLDMGADAYFRAGFRAAHGIAAAPEKGQP
jgi:hypothetical protein